MLLDDIKRFKPFNEQEERDKEEIIYLLQSMSNIFERQNKQCHMTASAWVVNKDHTKVLMAYHNIYDSWSWLGGHADGEKNLLETAVREVKEESGINKVTIVSKDIFSLEILTVDGHEKRGEYVSSHLHVNVTYLLEADEKEELQMKVDENNGVAWFALEDAVSASTEEWFKKRIYKKLNDKLFTMN